MKRRRLLRSLALSTPAIFWSNQAALGQEVKSTTREAHSLKADVVILGGGLGGVSSALSAARNGLRVILTEETDWIGGQLTAQAVPPDENKNIESYGANASYRELRNRIRDYYRNHYPLTEEAKAKGWLNPGEGGVSRLCHEPRVALAAMYEMINPHLSTGRISLLLNHKLTAAHTEGDKIIGVTVHDLKNNVSRTLEAPLFIDATELGDLLPLSGTEWVTGSESQSETGELHAPEKANPNNLQAATWCFPIEYVDGENFVGEAPTNYDFWRNYVPQLTPAWPGPLFSLTYSNPRTLEPRTLPFDPKTEQKGSWWTYRRIAWKSNFQAGSYAGSISLVNWPQNDYLLGHFLGSEEETRRHLDGARQLSLSLFHWLQTEAPRPEGGAGWPGLRLRPELTGSSDGLALYPYIREARRIRAEFTVLEQHVGEDARRAELRRPEGEVKAVAFEDSVGIGSYNIDLHPSTGGDNYIDVRSLPFQIPLGALIPQRVENLLAANKNIGTTHITNGCYRLHPVEWGIGEAAGALVAFCKARGKQAREVRNTPELLAEFQGLLTKQGVELSWPA